MITSNLVSAGVPSEREVEELANSLFPDFEGNGTTGFFDAAHCAEGTENLIEKGDTSVISDAVSKAESAENYFSGDIDGFNHYSDFAAIAESYNTGAYNPYGVENTESAPDYANTQAVSAYPQELTQGNETYAKEETKGYSPVVLSETQSTQNAHVITAAAETPDGRNNQKNNTGKYDNSKIIVGTKTLEEIRNDFPILKEKINGHPLVWLDNGATTQRPQSVIDRLTYYYTHENSNVHRGAHELAARSTDAYENARQIVADFIGAANEVVFVRGTTEGINLVSQAYVKQYLKAGDEIILTLLEHHANIVPWQLVAQETGAVLKVAPVDETGQIILSEYEKLFTPRTKFVSATHVSNALGTVTPIAEMIQIAHSHGVRILVDGAQSIAHIPINVTALDADFFVFSGHKIFGPTGIGAVYGKSELLEAARPYHGGGNMIKDVTFERTIYNPAPNKFEAGTGSIVDAVGLGAALEYLNSIGMEAVNKHEHELLVYAMEQMQRINGLHLVGTAANKASVLSFVLDGVDNETVGQRLNQLGIAVRTGHHCAQPILRHFGLEGTVRPTLALYNSFDDIDALVSGIKTLV